MNEPVSMHDAVDDAGHVIFLHECVEQRIDDLLAAFSHDNTALATDYRLHALTFDYVPLPKTMLSAIWYHSKPYEPLGAAAVADWIERIRVAFTVSF